MALTTKLQKNVRCNKCKEINCLPIPDKDGFASCVYCGTTQDRKELPPEPINYKELYGHLFEDGYEDEEGENKDWNLNISIKGGKRNIV